ncbi:hypothetical protein ACH5RR_001552 [Cinchona calisaya]|uniref:Gag-pol polyprotein n=1 Tax=Cinchona calisaya TaxID=153742 RepID=A0ABD3B403_9GENT
MAVIVDEAMYYFLFALDQIWNVQLQEFKANSEANTKKMDSFMASFDKKFNALFRMITKENTNSDGQREYIETPNLVDIKVKRGNHSYRKISAHEIQYRRNHGLCFKCGEKFGLGYQCQMRNLNFLVAKEDEDMEFQDAIGEQDKVTSNPGK